MGFQSTDICQHTTFPLHENSYVGVPTYLNSLLQMKSTSVILSQ